MGLSFSLNKWEEGLKCNHFVVPCAYAWVHFVQRDGLISLYFYDTVMKSFILRKCPVLMSQQASPMYVLIVLMLLHCQPGHPAQSTSL